MLESLRAVDFRCFRSLGIEIPREGAIFTGRNAQGKTALLEAVCMLVRLQSPRTRQLKTMACNDGAGGFGIAGVAWQLNRKLEWQSRKPLELSVEGEKRSGNNAYLEDGGLLVWMGNEDMSLIRGGGEGRRRYLDFIGCQLSRRYRRALHRYRRALRAKNLLLREGRGQNGVLASYEEILIEEAAVLREVRKQIAASLVQILPIWHEKVSGNRELAEIELVLSGGDDLAAALEEVRDKELQQRRSLVGPQRDDFLLRINEQEAFAYASEGQQRTLAIALKLGQGQILREQVEGCGEPIWLIDDIFGELDLERRNALMNALPENAQTLITTTHLDWLRELEGARNWALFSVKEGEVLRKD